jgi:ankyrin repeat protein
MIGTIGQIRSIASIPHNTHSGKALLRLHEVAFYTESIFKKYFLIPLATTLALPFLITVDFSARIFTWLGSNRKAAGFPAFLQDQISLISFVALLPLRLIAYYCTQDQSAIFSVRHSPFNRTWDSEHMAISVIRVSRNYRFSREIIRKMALTEEQVKREMSSKDQLLYRIGYIHNRPEIAKKFSSAPSEGYLSSLELAVQSNDQILLERIPDQLTWTEMKLCFEHAVVKGGDLALSLQVREIYQQYAVRQLGSVGPPSASDVGSLFYNRTEWLRNAVNSRQLILLSGILDNYSWTSYFRWYLSQSEIAIPLMDLAAQTGNATLMRAVTSSSSVLTRCVSQIVNKELSDVVRQRYESKAISILKDILKDDSAFSTFQYQLLCTTFIRNPKYFVALNLGDFEEVLKKGYCSILPVPIPTDYLHCALSTGDLPMVTLLLKYNVDLTGLDENMLSPLEKALLSPKHQHELVSLLCQKQTIDVNKTFEGNSYLNGHTALTYAASIGDYKLMPILLQFSGNKNIPPSHPMYKKHTPSSHPLYRGKIPYDIAYARKDIKMMELIDPYRFKQENIGGSSSSSSNYHSEPRKLTPAEKCIRDCVAHFEPPNSQPVRKELREILGSIREAKNKSNLILAFGNNSYKKDELKTRFRRICLSVHPDKNLKEREHAEMIFKTISAIYNEVKETLAA